MKKFWKLVICLLIGILAIGALVGPVLIQLHWGYPYKLALQVTPGNHSSWLSFWASYLGIIASISMAFIISKRESNQSKKLNKVNSINQINIDDLREIKSLINQYPYSGNMSKIYEFQDYIDIGIVDVEVEAIQETLFYKNTSTGIINRYEPYKIWSISKKMLPDLQDKIEPKARELCTKLDHLAEFTIEEFKKYTDEYEILLNEHVTEDSRKEYDNKNKALKESWFPRSNDFINALREVSVAYLNLDNTINEAFKDYAMN